MKLNAVMVRYIVNDVDDAIAFYTTLLGFRVSAHSGPHFAILARENFQLVLSPPKGPGGGSQPMPDGRKPQPGGWNRIIVQSGDLEGDIEVLKKAGVEFRNDIVAGPGGRKFCLRTHRATQWSYFRPHPPATNRAHEMDSRIRWSGCKTVIIAARSGRLAVHGSHRRQRWTSF